MQVQIQYVEGCPHWRLADERVRAALELAGDRATTVVHLPVTTAEDAGRLGFHGSPSILIDGRDPFPSEPATQGLSCRIYPTPDGPSGSPTLGQLLDAIAEARRA